LGEQKKSNPSSSTNQAGQADTALACFEEKQVAGNSGQDIVREKRPAVKK